MSIEDGMREYTIIIEEGSAGMGKYRAVASYGEESKELFVHQRSKKAACAFVRKLNPIWGDPSRDYTISLERLGPVNPGEYAQDGMDERDAVERLVNKNYKDAFDRGDIRMGVKGLDRNSITREIYQNWEKGKGVQIIPPAQMELDLFEMGA